jgi:hypothetical protein
MDEYELTASCSADQSEHRRFECPGLGAADACHKAAVANPSEISRMADSRLRMNTEQVMSLL